VTIAHLVIGGDVAGGQLIALAFARAARDRGDRVLFISPARGPFTELVEREGMDVRLVNVSRTFRITGALRLAWLLRRERVDVLHTHTALAANALSRVASRLAGVAVVSHIHIENYFRPNKVARTLHTALDNGTARLAARVLAVSRSTRDTLVEQGYPSHLVEVVHNGIDVATQAGRRADGLRAELGVRDGAMLLGEIGRLCDVKGQRELIEAAALVPGVHVVLVGDDLEQSGAYRTLLDGLARKRGVGDRVHLLGYRADAGELLDQLDVLVLPSWIEGLPGVVLEAMAHAKPVIATAVGGTPELIIDGETGVLVPPRDPRALADAITALIADPGRARTLGLAGRERAEREFSETAMTERVLEVYDAVA
jgi:glycosyltransferase involved in cell wall biosynthesis